MWLHVCEGGGGDLACNIGNTCNTDAIQYCHNPYEGLLLCSMCVIFCETFIIYYTDRSNDFP